MGRKVGIPNRTTTELRETIHRLGGDPCRFLANIIAGRHVWMWDEDKGRKVRVMPSIEQRMDAAKALLPRVLPAMQAIDANIDARILTATADLSALSPVEREQRLLAIRAELDPRLAPPRTDDPRQLAQWVRQDAERRGGTAMHLVPSEDELAREIGNDIRRTMEESDPGARAVGELGRAAAAAASQAVEGEDDDEAAVEAARMRAETVTANGGTKAWHAGTPKPEPYEGTAKRMARLRRQNANASDADD